MRRAACATLWAVLLAGASAAPAHGQAPAPAAAQAAIDEAAAFGGAVWTARRLDGIEVTDSTSRAPHLRFGPATVSGSDGCNRVRGSYTRTGERLTFGPVAGTQMACQGSRELAQAFGRVLHRTRGWRLDPAGTLALLDEQGATVATFAIDRSVASR